MHLVQALTSLHDRHFSGQAHKQQIAAESYHISCAAAQLKRKLSSPLAPADRDAIWAAGCLIGCIVFCSIEAIQASEAWPLAPSKPSDLEWIRINDAKILLWGITNPMRADSMFSINIYQRSIFDIGIPPKFSRLYGLDDFESESGPYAVAVRALVAQLPVECGGRNYVTVQGYIQTDFTALLGRRDAHALLLLAYWYARMCPSVWWVDRRARLECEAICVYLKRYHGRDAEIQRLLYYPMMRCGMLQESGSQYELKLAAEGQGSTCPIYLEGGYLPL